MDDATWTDLIGAHAAFPALLEGVLPLADAARMRARPVAGRWTLLEILVHLRDEEREDFRARAQAAAEGRAELDPIDPAGWVTARDYNAADPRAVFDHWARERAASVAWLGGLAPGALERGIDHAVLGRFRCGDFVAAWRMHDLLHLRQVATALVHEAAAALPGWRVDYAGAVPAA